MGSSIPDFYPNLNSFYLLIFIVCFIFSFHLHHEQLASVSGGLPEVLVKEVQIKFIKGILKIINPLKVLGSVIMSICDDSMVEGNRAGLPFESSQPMPAFVPVLFLGNTEVTWLALPKQVNSLPALESVWEDGEVLIASGVPFPAGDGTLVVFPTTDHFSQVMH